MLWLTRLSEAAALQAAQCKEERQEGEDEN